MNLNQSLKKLRLFAASPSDVATERAKLETVVGLLKPLADHIGLSVEVVDWRKVVPDMGRPQQVIFDQRQPTTWDVFIGILWHRFGTPPGGKDPQTQKEYLSGTEEEFKTAFRLWEQFKKPRIMMYRCTRQVNLDALDPDQFKYVKEFFAQFDAIKGEHPGLYQTFDSTEAFEKLLWDNLQKLLLEYSEKEKGRAVSPQEMQVLAPRLPDTLPRRQAFFGRKDEIAQALRALSPEDRGWGVVLDGIGGIGKTALAIEVAYLCKERGLFDAFVFVTAKRDRLEATGIKEITLAATTLEGLVNEAARALGQPGIAQLTGEAKARALLESLRGRRALVIFDNLETLTIAEQNTIGDFLRNLPQDGKAIITSRRRTGEAAVTIRLDKLLWEEAKELIVDQIAEDENLKRLLGRAGETGWKQLWVEAGGSPLALLWTMGLMRARGLSFEKALALLRDGSAASDLNAFIYREAHKKMDANERATLGALSLFGGPATFEALSATAELDRRALDSVLERLRALSLVDVIEGAAGEERYTLHPLTRRFARTDLATEAKTEYATGMRFARYWVDFAKKYGGSSKENYKTYDRLEAEWANLEAATNWAWTIAAIKDEVIGDKETARMMADFGDALKNFLWFGGRWDEGIQLGTRGYEAALALQDWSNAGWRAFDVCWIHYNRDRLDEATIWIDRCATLWAKQESKYEQATLTRQRGLIAGRRESYDEAERFYQEALVIWRNLSDTRGVSMTLNDLGSLALNRQDYNAAERYYREAMELSRQIGDEEGEAIYRGNLGALALNRKQWAEARQWYEQELALAKEVRRVDLIASATYGLARVWEAEGRPDLALPLAQEALAIHERLQHSGLASTRELVQRLTAAVQKSAA